MREILRTGRLTDREAPYTDADRIYTDTETERDRDGATDTQRDAVHADVI